jgi:hypothetical protein
MLNNQVQVMAQLQNNTLMISAIEQQPNEPDRVIVVEGE